MISYRTLLRKLWRPPFTDMRPLIVNIWGKPFDAFIRKRGDEIVIDPPKWYNGRPENGFTMEFKCEPPTAIMWTDNRMGTQKGIAVEDGEFWAEATTPDGAVFHTQRVKLAVYTPNIYATDPRYS